jgi:hypothetical protein
MSEDLFGAVDAEDGPQELDERVREEEPAVPPIAFVEYSEKRNPYVVQVGRHHFLADRHQLLFDGNAVRVNQKENGVRGARLTPQRVRHFQRVGKQKPLLGERVPVDSRVLVLTQRVFPEVAPKVTH